MLGAAEYRGNCLLYRASECVTNHNKQVLIVLVLHEARFHNMLSAYGYVDLRYIKLFLAASARVSVPAWTLIACAVRVYYQLY
jgi:hypothetical protein